MEQTFLKRPIDKPTEKLDYMIPEGGYDTPNPVSIFAKGVETGNTYIQLNYDGEKQWYLFTTKAEYEEIIFDVEHNPKYKALKEMMQEIKSEIDDGELKS